MSQDEQRTDSIELLRNRLPRRRVLKAAGLGLLGLPALAAARTEPRRPREPARQQSTRARLGSNSFGQFEQEIGRDIAIYRTYRSWGEPILNDTIIQLLERPEPPRLYLSFHAFYDSKGHNCIPWADIAAGKYDAEIDSWSAELLQIGRPTYIAFHQEMENEEGAPPNGCGAPADFMNAYWYFRRRMAVVNAVPNLTWIITYMHDTFAPSLNHGGPYSWWPAGSPYPDVPSHHLMGVDIYNRNKCHGKEWLWFMDLMNPTLKSPSKQKLTPYNFAVGVNRKIFIGEAGCVEGDDCGGTLPHGTEKAAWFTDALTNMKSWTNLEAFCYTNGWGFRDGNYRIDSSPESLAAFKALANDPFFSKPP
jgi:hypothetical protein